MTVKIATEKCRNVRQLIAELQKFPPNLPLSEVCKPNHYNYGKLAKELGLREHVNIENIYE